MSSSKILPGRDSNTQGVEYLEIIITKEGNLQILPMSKNTLPFLENLLFPQEVKNKNILCG
ncbi:MAG: hypothetical protein AB1414_01065 [bacterium]